MTGAAVLTVAAGTAIPVTAAPRPRSPLRRLAPAAAWTSQLQAGRTVFRLDEPAYGLALVQGSPDLEVGTPGRSGPFTLPITALVGRDALPAPVRFTAAISGDELTLDTDGAARLLGTTIVTGSPQYFTVKFTAAAGPAASTWFFGGGMPSAVMGPVRGGFTPDPEFAAESAAPQVIVGNWGNHHSQPFSPPPLMVGLDTAAGWLGVGLVGVPNASVIAYQKGSGIRVDYPLSRLAGITDRGAGGAVAPPAALPGPAGPGAAPASGPWLGFPRFAVTFAGSAMGTLGAYGAALTALGAARVAFPPGTRPPWWSWPITDTWGQQYAVDGLGHARPFTTAWVLSMVAGWRRAFGLQHFTLVIDAGWEARLGGVVPASGFGGILGMRRLIDRLHAEGLRVVLWWPLWWQQVAPGAPRTLVDPSAPGFAAAARAEMAVLLGSGPDDLDADGLKYDWGYLVPPAATGRFADPQDGLGAAALLHYMQVLAQAAWAAHPSALIDGGAAAPQFDGLEGMLRLYDADRQAVWQARALVAATADPLVAIDGDGFQMDATQADAHTVSSAVFGTPALYYVSEWAGKQPIPAAQARLLGTVMALSAGRGQGEAVPLPGGAWEYVVRGTVTAATLEEGGALVVYRQNGCGATTGGTLIGTESGAVDLPLPMGATAVRVRESTGQVVPDSISGHGAVFNIAQGVTYQLGVSGDACASVAHRGRA